MTTSRPNEGFVPSGPGTQIDVDRLTAQPASTSGADESILTNARLAGALYLVIIVAGVFSEIVRTSVIVPEDAAATAANIVDSEWLYRAAFAATLSLILCEAILTVILYYLFRPVSRTLSLLAAALRLITLPIYAGNLLMMFAALAVLSDADYLHDVDAQQPAALALLFLNLHNYGYAIGLTVFAVNCFVTGVLLVRARHLPSALGVLLSLAGAGYLANSLLTLLVPGDQASLTPVLLAPAFVAEVWFCLLLLRSPGRGDGSFGPAG